MSTVLSTWFHFIFPVQSNSAQEHGHFSLILQIKSHELDTRILGSELPINANPFDIAPFRQGGCLVNTLSSTSAMSNQLLRLGGCSA